MKLFLILISINLFAQDKNFLEKLKIDQEKRSIELIPNYINNRKLNYALKKNLGITTSDIKNSGKIKVVIKKGSYLEDLETKKIYRIEKELLSKSFKLEDFEGYKYIPSNDGKKLFRVNSHSLSNINEILKMHEPPRKFNRVVKKINPAPNDKDIHGELKFATGVSYINSNFYSDLSEDNNNVNLIGFNLTSAYYMKNNYHLYPGLLFSYDSFSQKNFSLISLHFGPTFNYKINEKVKLISSILLSVDSEVNFKTAGTNYKYNQSQTTFEFGAEKLIGKFYGDLSFGVSFRRQWNKVKATSNFYSLQNDNSKNDALLFYLGHWTNL
ncbi:MAG: hypothetical protein N4A33_12850 [Bacteriovoracaceae bacterium]|jgi:hypothetical protein|nr:hypothetical protein [Bacteriovoracaceae bacterium]